MKQAFPMLIAAFSVWAVTGSATEWKLRDGDLPLSSQEARILTKDRILEFYDDGQSRYFPDGRYSYTFSAANGGGAAHGFFDVQDDGSICVRYRNGRSRCDLFVRAGNRLVLITEQGDRFPVRP